MRDTVHLSTDDAALFCLGCINGPGPQAQVSVTVR